VSLMYILITHFVEASFHEIFPPELFEFLVCFREKCRILEVVTEKNVGKFFLRLLFVAIPSPSAAVPKLCSELVLGVSPLKQTIF
jgi:hypothetical protein